MTPLKLDSIAYAFDLVNLVPLTLVALIVTLALPRRTARIWQRLAWLVSGLLVAATGWVWWLWRSC